MKSSFLGKRCLHQPRADIPPRAGPPRRSCTPGPIQAAADLNQGLQHGKQHQRSKAGTAAAVATDKDNTWAPGQHSSLGQQVGMHPAYEERMVTWRRPMIAGLKSLLMLQPVNGNGKHKKFIGRPLSNSVHGVILAGGPSDNPLARYRAMPAVELGSNTQLVDVSISNCIRSGINKMYVLTQFNSTSLNTHITSSYPPAVFGAVNRQGYVDVLAATQTPQSQQWYKGSADAVRRNLPMILDSIRGGGLPDELLVLSGQALYRMVQEDPPLKVGDVHIQPVPLQDYGELVRTHRAAGADITIATHSVGHGQAQLRGLSRVAKNGEVEEFVEKPSGNALERMANCSRNSSKDYPFEASMGVYVFNRQALVKLLEQNEDRFGAKASPDTHFGHDVIPHALRDKLKVVAHHFTGYWREISSLRDFYEVNLELTRPGSPVSIYDVDEAIVSRGHILPPAIIHNCEITHSLIGEGSVLVGSNINGCVIGCNSYVGQGAYLEDSLIMGNDNYTNDKERAAARQRGESVLGIGDNAYIKGAIIDDNAAIGRNVRITNAEGVKEADRTPEGYAIQDGIVVVLRGATIPDGTHI